MTLICVAVITIDIKKTFFISMVITDEHASDISTFRHFGANLSSHNYSLYIIVYVY